MRQIPFRIWHIHLLSILLLFTTGCYIRTHITPVNTNLPVITATNTQTSTQQTPTFTITPTIQPVIYTSTPSNVIKASTRTPVDTPTATPVSTPTSLQSGPTLTSAESQRLLLDLSKNNKGCDLPCWWGFVPGVTPWEEVNAFYNLLGIIPEPYHKTYTTRQKLNDPSIELTQIYITNEGIVNAILADVVAVRNNYVIYGDPYYQQLFKNYRLPYFLTKYGPPEEVWIGTNAYAPEGGPIPYDIIMNYFKLGISVEYEGYVEQVNTILRICPQQSRISLYLWSPDKSDMNVVDYERNNLFVPRDALSDYKKIENATGMSLDQFYQTFKDPNNRACLLTPRDIWFPR